MPDDNEVHSHCHVEDLIAIRNTHIHSYECNSVSTAHKIQDVQHLKYSDIQYTEVWPNQSALIISFGVLPVLPESTRTSWNSKPGPTLRTLLKSRGSTGSRLDEGRKLGIAIEASK